MVRHVFTHFALDLTVFAARIDGAPRRGRLAPLSGFDPAALPGLMRKAWARWPGPPRYNPPRYNPPQQAGARHEVTIVSAA